MGPIEPSVQVISGMTREKRAGKPNHLGQIQAKAPCMPLTKKEEESNRKKESALQKGGVSEAASCIREGARAVGRKRKYTKIMGLVRKGGIKTGR